MYFTCLNVTHTLLAFRTALQERTVLLLVITAKIPGGSEIFAPLLNLQAALEQHDTLAQYI